MIPLPDYNNITPAEAVALQKQMREKIDVSGIDKEIKFIGGADISFNKFETKVYAGIIVLSYPQMVPVAECTVITETKFPYISGLLAFREVPALLMAWEKLQLKPDVLILDGQGIAHERRMGIATHFGLLTNANTIGCAKSKLTGNYEMPDNRPFAYTPLTHKNEQVGIVLRTRINCKPVFISPGNRVSIEQSFDIVKNCVGKYRIPEPTRLAHNLVNEARVAAGKNVLF